MSKLSKRLETRRQQARIAAAQAALDEAADPRRHLVTPDMVAAAPPVPAPAPAAPTQPVQAPATPMTPAGPVATTLPRVPALDVGEPDDPEPVPRRRRGRRSGADGIAEPPAATGAGAAPAMPVERPEPGAGGRGTAVVVALATVGIVAAVDVAIGRGTPVLNGEWDLWAVASAGAAGAFVYAVARFVLNRNGWAPTRRQLAVAGTLGVIAVAAFTLGVTQSVVIDGKVMATTSDAARSYEMATQMLDDLDRLAVIDDLVATDAAQAQARFDEFDGAQADAQEIADRWATIDINSVPAGELVPAVENLKSAGFAAAKAVESRKALVGTNDARLAADIESMRNTYIDAALGVGPAIADVEERFGFSVTDADADELE